jgi:hypothetical protein
MDIECRRKYIFESVHLYKIYLDWNAVLIEISTLDSQCILTNRSCSSSVQMKRGPDHHNALSSATCTTVCSVLQAIGLAWFIQLFLQAQVFCFYVNLTEIYTMDIKY